MINNFVDAHFILGALIAQETKATPQNNMMNFLTLVIIIFVAFYFLILRPQKKEQAKRKDQLDSLAKGDKIITIGGIYGTVVEINPNTDELVLQVDKNTRLTFIRSAVSKIIKKKDGTEQKVEGESIGNK